MRIDSLAALCSKPLANMFVQLSSSSFPPSTPLPPLYASPRLPAPPLQQVSNSLSGTQESSKRKLSSSGTSSPASKKQATSLNSSSRNSPDPSSNSPEITGLSQSPAPEVAHDIAAGDVAADDAAPEPEAKRERETLPTDTPLGFDPVLDGWSLNVNEAGFVGLPAPPPPLEEWALENRYVALLWTTGWAVAKVSKLDLKKVTQARLKEVKSMNANYWLRANEGFYLTSLRLENYLSGGHYPDDQPVGTWCLLEKISDMVNGTTTELPRVIRSIASEKSERGGSATSGSTEVVKKGRWAGHVSKKEMIEKGIYSNKFPYKKLK